MIVGVSACLLGENCRYDGGNCRDAGVLEFLKGHEVIAFCPEALGYLPTPRTPCEIVGGAGAQVLGGKAKVVSRDGRDFTAQYINGAKAALAKLMTNPAELVIMKSYSPSCGCDKIRDGSFTGKTKPGGGVAANLLMENGFRVMSQADIGGD